MKNFLFNILFFTSCKKTNITEGTPESIKIKIEEFDKYQSCSDAKVNEYEFQSAIVYVFEPGSCGADLAAPVYEKNGHELGYLGGIVGNTKINGQEFNSAKFVRTVWIK